MCIETLFAHPIWCDLDTILQCTRVVRNSSDIIAMPQKSTLYINHSTCFCRHAYTNMNLHSSECDRRSHYLYLQQMWGTRPRVHIMSLKLDVGGRCSNMHSPKDRLGKSQAKIRSIGYQWSVSYSNVGCTWSRDQMGRWVYSSKGCSLRACWQLSAKQERGAAIRGRDLVPRCGQVLDWVQSSTWPWSNWLGGRLLHNTNHPFFLKGVGGINKAGACANMTKLNMIKWFLTSL